MQIFEPHAIENLLARWQPFHKRLCCEVALWKCIHLRAMAHALKAFGGGALSTALGTGVAFFAVPILLRLVPLARAIGTLGEELAAAHADHNCPEFRLHVEGTSRDLTPLVRDEVHRIACEAVRNAFRHAKAGRIEVEIQYERQLLRLRILDNGKGIDQKVFAKGGRPGHFGLAGMQERAKLVGGKLSVWSKLDSGTEIELSIPASLAYTKSRASRRSLFSWTRNLMKPE